MYKAKAQMKTTHFLIRLEPHEIETLDIFYRLAFGRLIDVRKPAGKILEKMIKQVLKNGTV